jgi:hypothetical protein
MSHPLAMLISMTTNADTNMPVAIGESILRSKLQAVVGGSNQQGMTSCLNGSEFLLFHNQEASKEFGYDKWEGPQIDGSFLFTGQGVRGNQEMKRGNKGLVDCSRTGKPIHLFESIGTYTTYIGQVTLRSLIPETRRALDIEGIERDVFVYQLEFVGHTANTVAPVANSFAAYQNDWFDPGNIVSEPNLEPVITDAIDLLEFKIQSRFGNWLTKQKISVKQLSLSTELTKGVLKPDFFIPEVDLVVEAKASSSRNQVRLAIGQVSDYVHLAELAGLKCTGAILLPEAPTPDLCTLLSKLGIGLITETLDGFEVINCPSLQLQLQMQN